VLVACGHAEFKGKQELYAARNPQRLKMLREHAVIESAVSSNRIEGVSIDPSRIRDVLVAPKPLFRDRDEEEVRGYRDALKLIHEEGAKLAVDEGPSSASTAWPGVRFGVAGKIKGERAISGALYGRQGARPLRHRAGRGRSENDAELAADWKRVLATGRQAPQRGGLRNSTSICSNLPGRNGRVSRSCADQTYRSGLVAGRYISLERLIEEIKERYYETIELVTALEQGMHDPWLVKPTPLHSEAGMRGDAERLDGKALSGREDGCGARAIGGRRRSSPWPIWRGPARRQPGPQRANAVTAGPNVECSKGPGARAKWVHQINITPK
jgi:hypothetical protein